MALAEWDDSALIIAFNSAMSKYQQEMHGMAPKRKAVSTASDEGHEVATTSSDPLGDLSFVDEELGRDNGNEDDVEVVEPAADADAQAGVSMTPGVEEIIHQEQATWNEPYGYDAATAYGNSSGNEQHPALQQIFYHLQELEHHQQLLRQQLVESWAGYAGWQGMHQYGSNNFAQTYSGHSYPSGSPAVYPCYCHYHCHHPNFWPCRSPCGFVPPVYFPCAVPMQQQAPCCQSFRCHSTQHLCQAMNQCCPGLSNPRQHVAKACQDSGTGPAGAGDGRLVDGK